MIPRKKLREIACELLALSGDICGGVFSWTDSNLKLFARIHAGCALDDADLCALDRACEVGGAIARALHDAVLAMRFDDYRAALSRNIPITVQEFLLCVQKDALLRRYKSREEAKRYYKRARFVAAPTEDA